METIFDKNYNAIGDIEKSESGGWFAVFYNDNDGENDESYFKYKRDAVAWIKRKAKETTR